MSPDTFLENLFNEALERADPVERARFLHEACGANAALREQVEKLLRGHEEAAGFMRDPSRQLQCNPTGGLNPTQNEKVGDTIGRYKLLQQIGEGGCGIVYMAEQEKPVRRRVALKVIKLGMDTKQVIARFDAERQAMALMDHPNIAKVLEAGATGTGRPYFVMELIRGVKITDFCDEHKVSTEERLKLFIQVCQAIQHAHQKGIIHRDIKPSNILVAVNDGVALPKVIDFGIAKATQGRLTDQTLFTAFEQFMGTPAYMSPEQAVMTTLDVDTRSDIYSLGVLLYELLTGRPPFDQKELFAAGLDEMLRTIREVEPVKPSTRLTRDLVTADVRRLNSRSEIRDPKTDEKTRAFSRRLLQEVKGDLDWIVMKCLEKDRTRRYETANGLAADLQRHLSDQPIAARPPSRWYELQKTIRPHRVSFAAGATLLLVLAAGVVGSSWQAVRATRAEKEQAKLRQKAEGETKRAETEAARSKQVAHFMTLMLEGVGPGVAKGRDATLLREILEKTSTRIGKDLTNQPEVQGDLWNVLGETYEDIGDRTNVIVAYEESVKCYREAFGGNHVKLAVALGKLGASQSFVNRIAEGTNTAAAGLQMARALGDNKTLATCLIKYARSLAQLGSVINRAEPFLRQAVAIRETLGTNEALMSAYSALSISMTNDTEGEALTRRVLDYSIREHGEEHPDTAYQHYILGEFLIGREAWPEVAEEMRRALAGWRKFYAPSHPHRGIVVRFLVQALASQKKFQEAEAELEVEQKFSPANDYGAGLQSALKIYSGEWSIAPTNLLAALESKFDTNGAYFNLALMLARNGRMDEYRNCVLRMLKRTEGTQNSEQAEQAAKAALLFPADPTVVAAAGQLADFAVSANGTGLFQNGRAFFMHWALSTKALADYRRGNFAGAIEFSERALKSRSIWPSVASTVYCIEALAYTGLGDEAKARARLKLLGPAELKYRQHVLESPWEMGAYWGHRDWLMADILRREAEERLSQQR